MNDLVPTLQKWVGARGQNRLHLPPGWCCAPPLLPSLPPCRRWPKPAGQPPKPPMLVGGLPGTASVSSMAALPSGPAQTARGAGRSLPACFSFRASPGCSPDIPEGTSRRQSRPWLGKPGCRQPRGQKAPQCLPSLWTFQKLLNPWRTSVHPFWASAWPSRPPWPGVKVRLQSTPDLSGLPHSPGPAVLRISAQADPQPHLQLLVQRLPGRGGIGTVRVPLIMCQLLAAVRSPYPLLGRCRWKGSRCPWKNPTLHTSLSELIIDCRLMT